MIRKAGEGKTEVRNRIRDGIGDVTLNFMFDKEDLMGKGDFCAVVTFEPGCSIGPHPHEVNAEIYYILEGEITVTDNDRTEVLGPGDAMFTGGGDWHSAANTGKTTARMLAVVLA